MKKISFALLLISGLARTGQAADCKLIKLAGVKPQTSLGWEVSINKENARKKSGDTFFGKNKKSGKHCEVEIPSWGVAIFSAEGPRNYFVIEQGDTDYTTFTWVDPVRCKALTSLRKFGTAHVTHSTISFSGGTDGPQSIPAEAVKIGSNCLPIQ